MSLLPFGSSARISGAIVTAQMQAQLRANQAELARLQRQIASGRRLDRPSDDPAAAHRAITLETLLQRKAQIDRNLELGSSFLAATDTALKDVNTVLSNVRANAVEAAQSVTTSEQRDALAANVRAAVQRLLNVGNQKFRGRYLLTGMPTDQLPFEDQQGAIRYAGEENNAQSWSDLDELFGTSINGAATFGAISEASPGIDLSPSLRTETRLADLRGGLGVRRGVVLVSDGAQTAEVDLSQAETIDDVIQLLENNPPSGRTVQVNVANNGLHVSLDAPGGGQLTIRNVAGGATADDLGIVRSIGTGSLDIPGTELAPVVTLQTPLSSLNVGGPLDLAAGLQIVNGGQTHTIDLSAAQTVEDVLNVLNRPEYGLDADLREDGLSMRIRSRLSGYDFSIGENGGVLAEQLGLRTFTRETTLAELNYSRGVHTASGNDFTITRKDGVQFSVDVAGLQTIGDVIDAINNHVTNLASGVPLTARLASVGNGIELVHNDPSPTGPISVERSDLSSAAIDLGLIPHGETTASAAGASASLVGADVNPQEVHGIFNTLLRLARAMETDDFVGIQRASSLLAEDEQRTAIARAELGSQHERVDILKDRLADEQIQLKDALSQEVDADLTQVVAEFMARQAAYEAALRATANITRVTLLDYL